MLGTIIGDIVGSVYEFRNIKIKDFPLFGEGCHFTDDTVMTIAVADAIMQGERITIGFGFDAHGGIINLTDEYGKVFKIRKDTDSTFYTLETDNSDSPTIIKSVPDTITSENTDLSTKNSEKYDIGSEDDYKRPLTAADVQVIRDICTTRSA